MSYSRVVRRDDGKFLCVDCQKIARDAEAATKKEGYF
jgi:hypothetical protein